MTNPLFLAHRGHWHESGIENSVKAFQKTIQHLSDQCHGFECDFRQIHTDNPESWVVFHDTDMSRLTQSNAHSIDPSTRLYQNNQTGFMPTLTDFVQLIDNISVPMVINIEIKTGSIDGILHLIQLINQTKNHYVDIFYSSFDATIIHTLATKTTEKISYLIKKMNDLTVLDTESINRITGINIRFDRLTSEIINEAAIQSWRLGVYFDSIFNYQSNISAIQKIKSIGIIYFEA